MNIACDVDSERPLAFAIATDENESKLVEAEEAHFCEANGQMNMPSLLSL